MDLKELSPHLFWDVDVNEIDIDKNKAWFICRVLEYGLYKDWLFLQQYYGFKQIGEIALTLNDISKTTISFISLLADIPKEKFKCYSTKQLTSNYWNL